jgi:hypothetical protein
MRSIVLILALLVCGTAVQADIFVGARVVCKYSAAVAFCWDAPTTYTDGEPIAEPLTYRLLVGYTPGKYSVHINVVTTNITMRMVYRVPHYMAVSAVSSEGVESDPSNELGLLVATSGGTLLTNTNTTATAAGGGK